MQGLIGGAAGLVLGLVGIWVVNLIAPTIGGALGHRRSSPAGPAMAGPGGDAGRDPAGRFGGPRSPRPRAPSAEVVLNAP